jgi:hypothetical protein
VYKFAWTEWWEGKGFGDEIEPSNTKPAGGHIYPYETDWTAQEVLCHVILTSSGKLAAESKRALQQHLNAGDTSTKQRQRKRTRGKPTNKLTGKEARVDLDSVIAEPTDKTSQLEIFAAAG